MLCKSITDTYYDNTNNVITAVFDDRMSVVKSTWPKLYSVHDYNEKGFTALLATVVAGVQAAGGSRELVGTGQLFSSDLLIHSSESKSLPNNSP